MKKKSLFIAIVTLFFISISSAMTPCTDILKECLESNPYSYDENLHEYHAYIGYINGCFGFADACIEQE
ncbi:MAG: hypothetical protein FH748_10725 [Balneolaceae bacterium]|nr:hypothetical protein [Balneolaceae bacterium]